MRVYDSPNCVKCGATDTIEHTLLECEHVVNFWDYVQTFIDKTSSNNLQLIVPVKCFSKIPQKNDPLSASHVNLINWTLTIARYAIHKSAVYHRIHKEVVPPEAVFASTIKAHIRYQFKLSTVRLTEYLFPYKWCLGEAFARVENNKLVFTF